VTNVLELPALDETGPRRLGRMQSLDRLHARLLVRTHDVHALRVQSGRVPIEVAYLLDLGRECLRRFELVA